MTAVLFTCAGQRVDIVDAFRQAGSTTIAADVNPLAPALYHADHYALVPRVDDPEYVAALRRIVDAHDVRLIVPLTDLDQATLARGRDHLESLVLLPDAETAYIDPFLVSYLRGTIWLEAGDPATAALCFQHAHKLNPGNQ